jgi:hypothetical protein
MVCLLEMPLSIAIAPPISHARRTETRLAVTRLTNAIARYIPDTI